MHFRCRIECNGPEDTRQAEHILCFEERAVGTTIHFGSNDVLPFLEIRSNVEIGCITGVLGKTYIMAVNPQIEKGIYSVETDKYITSVPVFRDGELTTVRADFVTVFKGRPVFRWGTHHASPPVVDSHFVLEDNRLVHVNRGTILLCPVFLKTDNVPTGWHGDIVPA